MKRECQDINAYLSRVKPFCREAAEEARMRWSHVAHPLHSLGILEDAIIKIAGMTGKAEMDFKRKTVLILCGDNGIVEEGVTQADASVTASVVRGFTRGEGCVTLMAKQAGAGCIPVDLGIADAMEGCGTEYPLVREKIAWGTRNFKKEPAMTTDQVMRAIDVGVGLVEKEKKMGTGMIAVGEMGIGNTTTSSALAAVFLGKEAGEVTGSGAGLSEEGLRRKTAVIGEAIKAYGLRQSSPLAVLQHVGGLDLAGMVGVYLGGAIFRIPILVDGIIAAAGALTASRICPETVRYMLATHVSREPAGRMILDELGLSPIIDCGMCLGEGTGAVAAMPLFDMAARVYSDMRTFAEYQIEEYKPLT